VETSFEVEGSSFQVFDTGGERNERRKWIHCFESVKGVIFCVMLDDYAKTLYEDGSTNRMVENLQLFDEIVNSRWFEETEVMLVLTGKDLFAESVGLFPIADQDPAFEDYAGRAGDYDDGVQYFMDQLLARNQNPDKQIYTHVVNTLDPDQVGACFESFKDVVLRAEVRDPGMVA
jgi:hypothetical protein